MNDFTHTYFQFPICASEPLHEWLAQLEPVVEQEVEASLKALVDTELRDHEDILVYLHYMYFYRFAVPALEATAGREPLLLSPEWARFQLLTCLLGRFLDDLIDQDSGFWNDGQIRYWYSHFLARCRRTLENLPLRGSVEGVWSRAVTQTDSACPRLYQTTPGSGAIRKPASNPMPLSRYPERVEYFFCLPDALASTPAPRVWIRSYISALFFLYDIDDSINDIFRNVPTEPAFVVLSAGLDSEGRLKTTLLDKLNVFPTLKERAKALIISCRDSGRSFGYELGPAMLDAELKAFNLNQ